MLISVGLQFIFAVIGVLLFNDNRLIKHRKDLKMLNEVNQLIRMVLLISGPHDFIQLRKDVIPMGHAIINVVNNFFILKSPGFSLEIYKRDNFIKMVRYLQIREETANKQLSANGGKGEKFAARNGGKSEKFIAHFGLQHDKRGVYLSVLRRYLMG